MKLIARTGKSPESHPLEAVVCLQVCEAHLNTLSLISGFGKRLCLHLPSCGVACILMDIARDLARIRRGAALRSYWAHVAVPLGGAVEQGTSAGTGPPGLSSFPFGALENVAQNIALTEPVQSVLGEGRVVGNGVIEIEPADPSVGEMEPHLLAQLPLGADAEAVAY